MTSLAVNVTTLILLSIFSGDAIFAAATTSFDFGTLTFSRVKLIGEAHWTNGSVRLTRDLGVPNSGAGKIVYSKPVKFRQAGEKFPASFSTFFTFSITNLNPSSIGGGLAFVVSADGESIGDGGACMGILDAGGVQNGVVAVEFDTAMDDGFRDINGNHVGLDVNSLVSTRVGDLESVGIELKSGELINSWVDYSGPTQLINVYVSYSNSRPEDPIISAVVDLDGIIANDSIFVGLTGSTQGSTEIHAVEWWSFTSSFDETPSPDSVPVPPLETPPPPPSFSPSAASPAADISTTTSKSSEKCHNQLCKNGAGAVAGVVTAGAFFLAFCGLALIWAYKKKLKKSKNSQKILASNAIKMPKEFAYKDLITATKGFNSDRIIGNGAFGTVYKGILPTTNDVVAVKRSTHHGQGAKAEFLSELSIIGTLRHRNLIKLVGWCHDRDEILLVYDLMPNGSLDKALFESKMLLSWPNRVKILIGVASALAYLHQECDKQVIHRDIKSSNIMLDEQFNAKLGDFGLARQIEHDKSPAATVAAGTMGYLAPEYLLTGRATEETDVFSFGALVLEVATGRRPIEQVVSGGNLVDWVWGLYTEGRETAAVDRRLGGEYDDAEACRVIRVGLVCSHPDSNLRPSMRNVVQMLGGEFEIPVAERARPERSFTTSELLMTLQDSVEDLDEIMTTTSSDISLLGGGGGDGGGLDIV